MSEYNDHHPLKDGTTMSQLNQNYPKIKDAAFKTNDGSILIDPDTRFQDDELDEGKFELAINVQDKIKMKDNIAVSPFK